MTQKVISLDELKRLTGTESKPLVVEIEKGIIKKFAEAIGDANPLWQDEEYAKKTKYGGIIAPPELFCATMMQSPIPTQTGALPPLLPEVPLPLEWVLDGGAEWEFLLPVRPGDIITSTTKLVHVSGREGKLGKMVFFILETTHKNQRGETVARSRSTIINY